MSLEGQSRRFCDVCSIVRYPQYRTFLRSVATSLPIAFLRPNCKRLAQLRQLRMLVLIPGDTRRLRRVRISTARNLLMPRLSGSFLIAISRRISQDWRGARHRPLDSRIKANRVCWCGRRESRCLHIGLVQGVSRFLPPLAMCARSGYPCLTF